MKQVEDSTLRQRAGSPFTSSSEGDSGGASWEATIQQAEIGLAILESDGSIRSGNPSFCHQVGRKETDLQQLRIWDLFHAHDQERCLHLFAEVITQLQPLVQFEGRLSAEQHPVVLLQLLCSGRSPSGERQLLAQILRPHSGVASNGSAARPSLLQTVLSNIDAHVYMKDRRGRYIYLNHGAHLNQADYPPGPNIIGKCDHDILPEPWADAIVAFDRRVFEHGVPCAKRSGSPSPMVASGSFSVASCSIPPRGKASS